MEQHARGLPEGRTARLRGRSTWGRAGVLREECTRRRARDLPEVRAAHEERGRGRARDPPEGGAARRSYLRAVLWGVDEEEAHSDAEF